MTALSQKRLTRILRQLEQPGIRHMESLRFLLRDGGDTYGEALRAVFEAEGGMSARGAPRISAHRERVLGSIGREASITS